MTQITHKLKFVSFLATTFLLVLLSIFCQTSFAAKDNPETDRLIKTYVDAVRSDNIELIKDAWNELNNDPDAVGYMRQNMPQLNYLFQVRGLYFQMQAIQAQRPAFFSDKQGISATVEGATETLKKDLSPGAVEVANFSVSASDPTKMRTNGDIAAAAQGIPKVDNGQIALNNPNQNRLDNRVLINNRIQAAVEQKFQKPVEEPVPNGDDSIKTPLPADPDVRVQGLFIDVTFKKTSGEEHFINVFLNDRLIVRDLKISRALELLRVYVETGTNILKITTSDQKTFKEPKNPFVVVNFKKTLQGEQKFTLNLLNGSAQTLRIEASP